MKTASEWAKTIFEVYWTNVGRGLGNILNDFIPQIIAESRAAAIEEKTAEMAVLALGDSSISPELLAEIRTTYLRGNAASSYAVKDLLFVVDWLIARVDFMAKDNGYLEGIERGKVLGVREYIAQSEPKTEPLPPPVEDPGSGWGSFTVPWLRQEGVVDSELLERFQQYAHQRGGRETLPNGP